MSNNSTLTEGCGEQSSPLTEGCGEQSYPLINGFEDVMTFIKQQGDRIKELEKENKKLKNIENNDKQEMYATLEDLGDENKFYWESMEKLKEENKKLKQEKKEFEEFIKKKCEWEWDDWCAGGRDD